MLYSLKTKMNDEDYIAFNLHALKVYGIFQRQVMMLRILFIALIAVFSIYEIMKLEDKITIIVYCIIMIIFSAPILIFTPQYNRLFIKQQAKSMIKKGKAPYSKNSQMEFYDDFFIETTDVAKSEIKYSSIEKISFSEERKTLFLHLNKLMAHILPAQSFDSPEKMVEFIKFIKEKCTDAECLF